ncbi:hypothetical protein FG167_12215 [Lacinutrix sp. WUR7]|uniref:hypothetical protein n=1 Tax=Lacinutrix sp. WUR7 TaxID=2653681 RepID=UPI00193DB95A|nr:hypothetical protein [Lacinutrix sp. WUR7]QRM89961.1 hypothetical protein FG167_12215 [Lacinutrix sp. WUR7]
MKNIPKTKHILLIIVLAVFLIPGYGFSQEKRVKPPKRESKISSVDHFVDKTFNLYHKVFVYDSLTQAGVEIPTEIEDELMEHAEKDIDSLWDIFPEVFDDMANGNANLMKKGKATANLNKSKKVLRYCVLMVKTYFVGTEEEE